MKGKYILSGLLMVALVIGGTGYGVAADSGGKVTGGGTFNHAGPPSSYANFGDKISFGFNGQTKNGVVKGQFQLVNHDKGIKMHGTFDTYNGNGPNVYLAGECSINGTNEPFRVRIATGAPWEVIQIWIGDSSPAEGDIYGHIYKGNITKHDK